MGDGALSGPADPDAGGLDAVARWPVRSAAAGAVVVGPGSGPAVVEHAGDLERRFAWASVTKLAVALAVLVATEEGTLGLDDPAGPPGACVRHLLAHASGLSPDGRRILAPPGARRIYSNAGFEVLADTLARRAGMAFTEYLRAGVLDPLDMTGTELPPGAPAGSGISGPLGDLLALGAELLAPRLVAPQTLHDATAVAFPGLVGVLPGFGREDPCDWGLGFELKDAKAPHWTAPGNSARTFGHFGQSGGFLWVDPVAGVACAALSDGRFGPWARQAWPTLSARVLDRWGGAQGGPGPMP